MRVWMCLFVIFVESAMGEREGSGSKPALEAREGRERRGGRGEEGKGNQARTGVLTWHVLAWLWDRRDGRDVRHRLGRCNRQQR